MDLVCAPKSYLTPSPQASITILVELLNSALPKRGCSCYLVVDQNKEGTALQERPKPSGDQIFYFRPFHALTPGFPPETFQWEVGSQRPQQQASVLNMLVESGLS